MRRIRSLLLTAGLLAGVVTAAVVVPATPSGAIAFGAGGITAGITVTGDLASCASVEYASSTTFVGEYTASGVLYGPGTIVVPVAGAKPIAVVNGDSWSACIPGGWSGATSGYVVYTLSVTSPTNGEYVEVKQCTVTFGSVFCV